MANEMIIGKRFPQIAVYYSGFCGGGGVSSVAAFQWTGTACAGLTQGVPVFDLHGVADGVTACPAAICRRVGAHGAAYRVPVAQSVAGNGDVCAPVAVADGGAACLSA